MRIYPPCAVLSGLILSFCSVQAQTQPKDRSLETRPRTVTPVQQSQPAPVPTKQMELEPAGTPAEAASGPVAPLTATPPSAEEHVPGAPVRLSPATVRTRIGEAERLLKTRPLPTALTLPSIEFVTLAALDRATARIHLIMLPKQTFLQRGAEVSLTTSEGALVNLRILRANGVNTAVTIFDNSGNALAPLVVQFPIEKGGVFREMAYYTSAHPALLSKELVRSGQNYVRSMLDLAAKRLRDKGVFISPQIVDVAERLSIVEHIDHERFRSENRLALYDEIYSLYALNELDTYRYSVSSAGAGGMVQMIPWAYNLMRQRHPAVGLTPDFVAGMRNHSNALQAMLLYMQDTWNDLTANDEVKTALDSKTATPAELLAAGYNSNAARLPGYLRRGGDGWRTLIPRETQMYLQIYKSFESLVPLKSKTPETN
ncbi:MAG TPA: hypothetical protein VI750_02050 [Pyrinomonadaceae bacterium]|nr:hypothetical protein [Pyrinomonadaceae bacterium]